MNAISDNYSVQKLKMTSRKKNRTFEFSGDFSGDHPTPFPNLKQHELSKCDRKY